MSEAQSYKNHSRWDPAFHFFIAPVLLLNIFATAWWYHRHYYQHVHSGIWLVLISVVIFMMAGKMRGYSLKIQDRLIRTEERQRIAMLVTPSELIELESLTIDQYVGLRFASNPELPELARRAVREKLTRKQIKESVKSWRADNDRV